MTSPAWEKDAKIGPSFPELTVPIKNRGSVPSLAVPLLSGLGALPRRGV